MENKKFPIAQIVLSFIGIVLAIITMVYGTIAARVAESYVVPLVFPSLVFLAAFILFLVIYSLGRRKFAHVLKIISKSSLVAITLSLASSKFRGLSSSTTTFVAEDTILASLMLLAFVFSVLNLLYFFFGKRNELSKKLATISGFITAGLLIAYPLALFIISFSNYAYVDANFGKVIPLQQISCFANLGIVGLINCFTFNKNPDVEIIDN